MVVDAVILVKQNGLYMKEQKNMRTLTRRSTNKVQFMNICQFVRIIATLNRLEVTLLFLTKHKTGTNYYLKKHY